MSKRNIKVLHESKEIIDSGGNNSSSGSNDNKKIKLGENIEYSKFDSQIGKLTVYANKLSIIKISLEGSAVAAQKLNNNYTFLENNKNEVILQFKNEMDQFFKGEIKQFKTPYSLEYGSEFQKLVWNELIKIPYGDTVSYTDIALRIGKEKKYARAVASACRLNNHLLMIPCHRVINSQGCVVGYGGKKGIDKQFIISNVEKKFK